VSGIWVYGHKLDVGDVRALHYLQNGRLSDGKRNYRVTSLDPLMGLELWVGGGGHPRREWPLSRKGIELVRPGRSGRSD
jgi:hypothetical protein